MMGCRTDKRKYFFTQYIVKLRNSPPQEAVMATKLDGYKRRLDKFVKSFGVRCHQYADDTQLYYSFSSSSGEAVDVLNRCLAAIMDWMGANKLKLNPDKTETLLVSAFSAQMEDVHPVLDGVTLPLKEQVRSLGVLFDPSLSLEAQVASVARNAFYHLRLVAQLHPYLCGDDLASVVHALVTSRLDYCNALYVGLPLKMVRKLQLVQNAAARLLTRTNRSSHITPVLARLHWLPICFRARFKVLVLTYKALHGVGPQYLMERLSCYEPTRALGSTSKALLRVPTHREARRVMTRSRAFSVVAPELWNSLPEEVCLAPTLLSFRRQAKTFLFSQAF
ncbi:uncharacterized protein LOC133380529 [Rhineura floridana]|uniref:uncharacterized protein LOC133380529 n=1 Tax=Rhineura floridana TaxID=261503 RepID=UPI002AC7F04D|nr:uncharacterized protein LOC133380529 [Rhineura floridana]XP_061473929.1 uncharacterized protein LOC133380529 [Rhineura floridana]